MRQILLIASALLFFFFSAYSQGAANKTHIYNLDNGLAMAGYDPVSYFKGKPMKGSSGITTVYDGVTYHFANQQDLDAFKKNPAAYEPQYGGWCAYAMGSTGEKVEVDPETYKIINGKLYLFYNHLFNNTLKSWNKNESYLKQKADQNWVKYEKK